MVTDLPFASYESSPQQAFESAAKLLRDGHAEAVKLEGEKKWLLPYLTWSMSGSLSWDMSG